MSDRRGEVYQDAEGLWRWRVVANRGNLPDLIIGDSGQGYRMKDNAVSMFQSLHPGMGYETVDES